MNTLRLHGSHDITEILHVSTCRNCEHLLDDAYGFCPGCGQKAKLHRLSFHDVLHEILHAVTHADAGIFALTKALLVRPGVVARDYTLEGKRKRWFNPFTFLALTTAARVASSALFRAPPAVAASAHHAREQALRAFIDQRLNLIIFAFVPFAAVLFWAFFRKRGARLAEIIVAQVFFSGFMALVDAALFPLGRLYARWDHVGGADQELFGIVHIVAVMAYYACAYRQLFRLRGALSYAKTFGVSALAFVSWFVIWAVIGHAYIGGRFG